MALMQSIDSLDRSLVSPNWTSLEKVTALIENQLNPSGSRNDHASSRVVNHWSRETMMLLEDLKSVSIDSLDKADPKARDAWHMCEEGPEHRAMHRAGPVGSEVHALCMEGLIDSPVEAALAMTRDAGFFKEWWPQNDMPVYKIMENKYLARVADGFDITYMKFKVPWPFPWQEFAMIFFSIYDAETGVTNTVVRTLPEDPSFVDPSLHGFPRSVAPSVPKGMVRMAIDGGMAIKDVGGGRCHFRAIFTVDLKLPAVLVNFVTSQFGGVLFNVFRKEVETVLADETTPKGAAFKKVLQEEQLYGRVREAMGAYRAGEADRERRLAQLLDGEGSEVDGVGSVSSIGGVILGGSTSTSDSECASDLGTGSTAPQPSTTPGPVASSNKICPPAIEDEDVFEDAEDELAAEDNDLISVPPAYASAPTLLPITRAAVDPGSAAAAALAVVSTLSSAQDGASTGLLPPGFDPQQHPDVFQAMATLEKAIEDLRARTAAAVAAAAAAGTLLHEQAGAAGAAPGVRRHRPAAAFATRQAGGNAHVPPSHAHAQMPPGDAPAHVPQQHGRAWAGGRSSYSSKGGRRRSEYHHHQQQQHQQQQHSAPPSGRMSKGGSRGSGGMRRGYAGEVRQQQQQQQRHFRHGAPALGGAGDGMSRGMNRGTAPATVSAQPAEAAVSSWWSAASSFFDTTVYLTTCCTSQGMRQAEAAGAHGDWLLPEEPLMQRYREDYSDEYSDNSYDSEEDLDDKTYGNGGHQMRMQGYGGGSLVDERAVWRERAGAPTIVS